MLLLSSRSLCFNSVSLSEGQRLRSSDCLECYGRGSSHGSVHLGFRPVEGQDLECQVCWEQECLGIDPEAKEASGIKCS